MPAGEDAPRVLGVIEQDVYGVADQRIASAYPVWRHQRTARRYADLSRGDSSVVDEILEPFPAQTEVIEALGEHARKEQRVVSDVLAHLTLAVKRRSRTIHRI